MTEHGSVQHGSLSSRPVILPLSELPPAAFRNFRCEWLLNDGAGGSAAGSISGVRTRPSHGLLIASFGATRRMLWQGVEEEIEHPQQLYLLSASMWRHEVVDPQGFNHITRFQLEGTLPCWQYSIGDLRLEKRIWMVYGRNTTYVQYRLLDAPGPVALVLKVFANNRLEQALTRGNPTHLFEVDQVAPGILRVSDGPQNPAWHLLSLPAVTTTPELRWAWNYYYLHEAERGAPANEDLFCVCSLHTMLCPGEQHTLVGTLEPPTHVDRDPERSRAAELERQRQLLHQARASASQPALQRLVLAADQFLHTLRPEPAPAALPHINGNAPQPGTAAEPVVVAGYPWADCWSRDTLVALPGLLLACGRYQQAIRILRRLAEQLSQGQLPDRYLDPKERAHFYNVDAALWLFYALRCYHRQTGDGGLVATLYYQLVSIVDDYRNGTRHGIIVTRDGLLRAGRSDSRLTWMDHHLRGYALTPRIGKPVEINALWYNALLTLAEIAPLAGHAGAVASWKAQAAQVAAAFERFWYADGGYLYDVIDGPNGNDPALRPNQILAVGLPDCPLPADRARSVVAVVERALLTPFGLRSLAPGQPGYQAAISLDQLRPHQGAAWPWLLGSYVDALYRVHPQADPRPLLEQLIAHLDDSVCGSISELFDGEAPQQPHGRAAHAAAVAELLRVLQNTAAPAR